MARKREPVVLTGEAARAFAAQVETFERAIASGQPVMFDLRMATGIAASQTLAKTRLKEYAVLPFNDAAGYVALRPHIVAAAASTEKKLPLFVHEDGAIYEHAEFDLLGDDEQAEDVKAYALHRNILDEKIQTRSGNVEYRSRQELHRYSTHSSFFALYPTRKSQKDFSPTSHINGKAGDLQQFQNADVVLLHRIHTKNPFSRVAMEPYIRGRKPFCVIGRASVNVEDSRTKHLYIASRRETEGNRGAEIFLSLNWEIYSRHQIAAGPSNMLGLEIHRRAESPAPAAETGQLGLFST